MAEAVKAYGPARGPVSGEVLWALDLDESVGGSGQPWRAHQIVEPPVAPPNGQWPQVLRAACGEKFTSTHSRGWWGCKPGVLPLAAHAIHCSAEVVAAR